MSVLENFSIEKNFWKENPQFRVIALFNKFYKNDKSKSKTRSSKTMWSICLLEHPDSKFSDVSRKKRIEIISEDYLEEDIAWTEKYREHRDKFVEVCPTRNERISQQWGDKLDERMAVIGETPYTLENSEVMDKVMSNTGKIWKVYQDCLKDLEEERAKGQVQGGAMESLTEQGLI